ncbi:hypothetical protein D3C76_1094130 [compost metagenome]
MHALDITPSKPKKVLEQGESTLLGFDMGTAARYFDVPRDTIAQRTRKIAATDLQMEEHHA